MRAQEFTHSAVHSPISGSTVEAIFFCKQSTLFDAGEPIILCDADDRCEEWIGGGGIARAAAVRGRGYARRPPSCLDMRSPAKDIQPARPTTS